MSERVKRYVVFACSQYYPSGGWEDMVGSYDDLTEAKASAGKQGLSREGWAYVVDLETGETIDP